MELYKVYKVSSVDYSPPPKSDRFSAPRHHSAFGPVLLYGLCDLCLFNSPASSEEVKFGSNMFFLCTLTTV